jgi:L-lactate permease
MNDNTKKILGLALAVAIGLFIFKIVWSVLSGILGIVVELAVIGVVIYAGIYFYKKFSDN